MSEPTCTCGAPLTTIPCLWCAAFRTEGPCPICQGTGQVKVCSVSRQRRCPIEPAGPQQLDLFPPEGEQLGLDL